MSSSTVRRTRRRRGLAAVLVSLVMFLGGMAADVPLASAGGHDSAVSAQTDDQEAHRRRRPRRCRRHQDRRRDHRCRRPNRR